MASSLLEAKHMLTDEEYALLGAEKPSAGKPRVRRKVPLGKGFGQLDWMRVGSDMGKTRAAGMEKRWVSQKELAEHGTAEDCWMAVKGRVFDLTPYLSFHPGGREILLKVAGTDATRFFDYFHSFVNFEKLLENCLIGLLEPI